MMQSIFYWGSLGFLIYMMSDALFFLIFGCLAFIKNESVSNKEKLLQEIKEKSFIPVSIIVPITKNSLLVEESLSTIKNQLDITYEIILVSEIALESLKEMIDESISFTKVDLPYEEKIKTKKITEIYEGNLSGVPVLLVKKENGGKSDAINAGLNVSHYPYVFIVSPNKILKKDTLSKFMKKVLEEENTLCCMGNTCYKKIEDNKEDKIRNYFKNRVESPKYLTKKKNIFLSPMCALYEKKMLIKIGGFSPKIKEDISVLLRMYQNCKKEKKKFLISVIPNIKIVSLTRKKELIMEKIKRYMGLAYLMWQAKTVLLFQYGISNVFLYFYYFLYELVKPIIVLLGIIVLILAYFNNIFHGVFLLIFFVFYILIQLMVSSLFQYELEEK